MVRGSGRFKTSGFIVGGWVVITNSVGFIDHLQVTFKFHIKTTVLNLNISIQMSNTHCKGFQQRTHYAFEKILAGITLIFFFDVDVTIIVHRWYVSFEWGFRV
jgi:hypothetical protein